MKMNKGGVQELLKTLDFCFLLFTFEKERFAWVAAEYRGSKNVHEGHSVPDTSLIKLVAKESDGGPTAPLRLETTSTYRCLCAFLGSRQQGKVQRQPETRPLMVMDIWSEEDDRTGPYDRSEEERWVGGREGDSEMSWVWQPSTQTLRQTTKRRKTAASTRQKVDKKTIIWIV